MELWHPVSYQGYDYATVLIGEPVLVRGEPPQRELPELATRFHLSLSELASGQTTTSGAAAAYGEGNSGCCDDDST